VILTDEQHGALIARLIRDLNLALEAARIDGLEASIEIHTLDVRSMHEAPKSLVQVHGKVSRPIPCA
jgi:hypothetical protein